MSTWTTFLLTYLFGGITFIPLVLVTVLLHAHFTFPVREDDRRPPSGPAEDDIVQPGDDLTGINDVRKGGEKPRAENKVDTDVTAGYFAICREYTPMGINAKPIERSTPVGSTTVTAPSPSVYQTMYRSLFDRKQNSSPIDKQNNSQRPKKAGNVFYVVLRHGHLMLFDDDEQLEVRHVISLSNHHVSIYSGGDTTPEGELFIKRTAICLARRNDSAEAAADTQLSKPFFLFSENCSAKEDFYFALLRSQHQSLSADDAVPSPLAFDIKHVISLVQKLHSSEDHQHTRWLNAMIGRLFLAIYKTKDMENLIREKLTKKISRVKRPSFLSNITIKGIDTGEAAPYFTNPRLRDLTVEGECSMEADVRYTGKFRLEVAATARLELGSRLKAREVSLVLAVVVKKLEGHILFKIKPPPSNRVWFSFQSMPKVELSIEPIVSSRQITYNVILRQIENRIKEVIAETLVLPFWDDLAFFKTEHKNWRGGIFEGDDAVLSSLDLETALAQVGDIDDVDELDETGTLDMGAATREKRQSMPVTGANAKSSGFFGRKKGDSKTNGSLISSTSSLPTSLDTNTTSADDNALPERQAAERSPFANSWVPSTGSGDINAEAVRPSTPPSDQNTVTGADPTTNLHDPGAVPKSVTNPYKPYITSKSSSQSSLSSREVTDTEKDTEDDNDKDQDKTPQARRNTVSSSGSQDDASSQSPVTSLKGSLRSQTGSLTRGLFGRKETLSADSLSTGVSEREQQRRNALATVTNVAVSAKRWGLSALQRNNDSPKNGALRDGEPPLDLKQPMGRGRPLPPPGTPLPMPERKTKTAPAPVPKRKPVPPPFVDQHLSSSADRHDESGHLHHRPPPPPLPKRRSQLVSEQGGDDAGGMLVVAAPTESEPTTPLSATHPPFNFQPSVEDAEDDEHMPIGGPRDNADSVRRAGLDLVGLTRVASRTSESASASQLPSSEQQHAQDTSGHVGENEEFPPWKENGVMSETGPADILSEMETVR